MGVLRTRALLFGVYIRAPDFLKLPAGLELIRLRTINGIWGFQTLGALFGVLRTRIIVHWHTLESSFAYDQRSQRDARAARFVLRVGCRDFGFKEGPHFSAVSGLDELRSFRSGVRLGASFVEAKGLTPSAQALTLEARRAHIGNPAWGQLPLSRPFGPNYMGSMRRTQNYLASLFAARAQPHRLS